MTENPPSQQVEQFMSEVERASPRYAPGIEQDRRPGPIRQRAGCCAAWFEVEVEDLDVTDFFENSEESLSRAFAQAQDIAHPACQSRGGSVIERVDLTFTAREIGIQELPAQHFEGAILVGQFD